MKIKKYEAKNMKEAMKIIKADLGPDAVILTTKKVVKNNGLGIFSSPVLEVTAAVDYDENNGRGKRLVSQGKGSKKINNSKTVGSYSQSDTIDILSDDEEDMSYPPLKRIDYTVGGNPYETLSPKRVLSPSVNNDVENEEDLDGYGVDDILRDLSEHSTSTAQPINNYSVDADSSSSYRSYRQQSSGFNAPERVERKPLEEVIESKKREYSSDTNSALTPEKLSIILQDISDIKKQVSDIRYNVGPGVSVDLPSRLKDIHLILCKSGVDDVISYRFLKDIEKLMSDNLSNIQLKNIVMESLAQMIPIETECFEKLKNKVTIFVGPTGVGKTTTVAKLAAKLKLEQNKNVALITIDNYRIGAIEQLSTYADIVNIPLFTASTPSGLKSLIRDLNNKDYDHILIDSMGRSQFDSQELNAIKTFTKLSDEMLVVLILSLSSNHAELGDTVERYSILNPEYLIFTKLDETRYFGTLLNVSIKRKLPILLLGTGQNVPDDIEIPNGKRIARKVLQEIPSLWNDKRLS